MGLRPEFENVRSSIQHRVPPPDIERAVADVRSEETRLAPGWVLGVDLILLRVLQIRLNMLRDIDPIVRIFNLEALLVHQTNETCPRSYATIARSRVT